MTSRSGTANGANRDVERAYESGRRATRAERDLYAIRCGPGRRACLRIGTACVLTDRDDERYGADLDGERTAGTAFDMRRGYDRRVRTVRFGTMCERDGAARASTHENYDVPGSRSWRRSSVAQGARGAPSKVMINGLFGSASCPPS